MSDREESQRYDVVRNKGEWVLKPMKSTTPDAGWTYEEAHRVAERWNVERRKS